MASEALPGLCPPRPAAPLQATGNDTRCDAETRSSLTPAATPANSVTAHRSAEPPEAAFPAGGGTHSRRAAPREGRGGTNMARAGRTAVQRRGRYCRPEAWYVLQARKQQMWCRQLKSS